MDGKSRLLSFWLSWQDSCSPQAASPSHQSRPDRNSGERGNKTQAITLTAKNIAFDKTTLTTSVGSTVVMTSINNDAGIPHNFALYTDQTATGKIFAGNLVTGVATTTYTYPAPSVPGNYFFRCDVHQETMNGTFVVT